MTDTWAFTYERLPGRFCARVLAFPFPLKTFSLQISLFFRNVAIRKHSVVINSSEALNISRETKTWRTDILVRDIMLTNDEL